MKCIKLLIMAIAMMCVSNVDAQEQLKKAVLGIEDFTYASSFSEADVEMVRNQIVQSVRSTGRVIVVDHHSSTATALVNESERRKQESAMDANSVADMTSLNANSIMTVHLDQLAITREIYEDTEYQKGSDGKSRKVVKGRYPYYKAVITYTVKITDCANGAVQSQESYTYSAGSFSLSEMKPEYDNEHDAHQGIMNRCVNDDDFKKLILNTFRAEGKILQVEDGDAKKAKTVYASVGSEDGIQKKQVLEVFKEIDIAGEISKKLIGEIEVIEVLGPSRCLAKVKKGGDIIQQELSAGKNLPVRTREVKERGLWGLGGLK